MARLPVKIVPRAARSEIAGWHGDSLRIRIAAAPEKGRANSALVDFLAETLGLPRRQVRIASGHTSARKIVEVSGIEMAELSRRLPVRPEA